jgi:formiminoglutamase
MSEPDMSVWTGRVDAADGPQALRWHQVVKPFTPDTASTGVALIGFACDEGVRRNGGRVGAAAGPRAIRQALANMAWQDTWPVYDAGDVDCPDDDLEAAQSRLAEVVAEVMATGLPPIVLGGGHETAWGTFRGLTSFFPDARIGVINIDAHLDMRADVRPNSGTPFRQIADWCQEHDSPFEYLVLGVSPASNTAALFDRAKERGGGWVLDVDIAPWKLDGVLAAVAALADRVDRIHLSIDLDVLPAALMPAVSAPAARGISFEAVEAILTAVLQTKKLAPVDIVELNPVYDIDGRGARLAARLVWHVVSWYRL